MYVCSKKEKKEIATMAHGPTASKQEARKPSEHAMPCHAHAHAQTKE